MGTPAAVEAFTRWCSLYKDYGLPVSYDFYNRFRTGEIPLAIASYTEFARLESAAPEIRGLWEMAPIPGAARSDGTIDRAQAGSGSACVILSRTEKLEASWDFLKWYCSAGGADPLRQGCGGADGGCWRGWRWPTARRWPLWPGPKTSCGHRGARRDVREIPEVLGGYYLIRGLDNAFRDVVYEGKNPRESLVLYDKQVNGEIQRKRKEFGLE